MYTVCTLYVHVHVDVVQCFSFPFILYILIIKTNYPTPLFYSHFSDNCLFSFLSLSLSLSLFLSLSLSPPPLSLSPHSLSLSLSLPLSPSPSLSLSLSLSLSISLFYQYIHMYTISLYVHTCTCTSIHIHKYVLYQSTVHKPSSLFIPLPSSQQWTDSMLYQRNTVHSERSNHISQTTLVFYPATTKWPEL